MTWEQGMMECLELYTQALLNGNSDQAIRMGSQMIRIAKTLDRAQLWMDEQTKVFDAASPAKQALN